MKNDAESLVRKLRKKKFTKTQLALMFEIGDKMEKLRKSGVHVFCACGDCNATRITAKEYNELETIVGEDIESYISNNLETINFCQVDDCGGY